MLFAAFSYNNNNHNPSFKELLDYLQKPIIWNQIFLKYFYYLWNCIHIRNVAFKKQILFLSPAPCKTGNIIEEGRATLYCLLSLYW